MSSSFYVKARFGPYGNYILCGSGDDCGYIWQCNARSELTARPLNCSRFCGEFNHDDDTRKKCVAPVGQFGGHLSEVTSVDFSRNDVGTFATVGEDQKCCIWKLGTNNRESRANEERFFLYTSGGRKRKRIP